MRPFTLPALPSTTTDVGEIPPGPGVSAARLARPVAGPRTRQPRYFPAVYGHASHDTAKAFLIRLAAHLTFSPDQPVPRTPAERMLADLWRRTASPLSAHHRAQLSAATRSYLNSHLWEHHYNSRREVPDPIDFVGTASSTFGSDFMLTMSHIRHHTVPADVFAATLMVAFDNAVRDVFRLINDLFSYAKETQTEGEVVNGLVVFGQPMAHYAAELRPT